MLLVRDKNKYKIKSTMLIQGASLLFVVISFSNQILSANCEAKEFDWSDLGVSLSGAKSALTGSNNLRILVSPQRRVTKNYEFDYANSSQPIQAEANYVIPGSSGSYSSSSQGAQSASHSNAYSALSASLASLKSRLSARAGSLNGSPLGDSSSVVGGSNGAYSNGVVSSSYANPSDPSQQQQQQQQSGVVAGQQPTYLSVSTGTGPHVSSSSSAGGYSVSTGNHGQGSDNKTIVLAIPAKINFLTDAHLNKQQQASQQQQQVTLAEQQQQQIVRQPTIEYSTGPKDNGVSGLEHSLSGAQIVSTNQVATLDGQLSQDQQQQQQQQQQQLQQQLQQYPQQQYVIVNSTPTNDQYQYQPQQYVAAPSGLIQPTSIYSSLYSKLQPSNLGSIAMKYIPTAIYQQQPLPTATIQLPQVQKVYTTATEQAQQSIQVPAAGVVVDVEEQTNRYTCLDTCNSADPRWRHASVSRYKYCCSRSSQYDLSHIVVDHPSVEKVNESSKTADDAYYSYLYRKTRARRSRRPHTKSYRYRYSQPTLSQVSPSTSSVSSSQENEEPSIGSNGNGYGLQNDQQQHSLSGGRGSSSSSNSGAHYYEPSPYMKYYKYRQQSSSSYEQPSAGDVQSGKYDAQESSANTGGSWKSSNKERSYRRGRGKDFSGDYPESGNSNQADGSLNEEDAQSYPPSSSGYGNGEYSVESRYPMNGAPQHLAGIDHPRQPYQEEAEEPVKGYGSSSVYGGDSEEVSYGKPSSASGSASAAGASSIDDYSNNGQDQANEDGAQVESQQDGSSYPANKYVQSARAIRKYKSSQYSRATSSIRKYKQQHARKGRKGAKYSSKQESQPSSQTNGTDYDSAQAGVSDSNGYHHPSGDHQPVNNEQQDNEQQYQKDLPSNNSGDNAEVSNGPEKEAMSVANKYKASINDTTVANLSRTTMHLKEILSLLEKKAHLKSNESSTTVNQQQVTPTSTPAPITTTSIYPFSSLFSSPAIQNALSNDYLTSEFGLKSPYRFEPSSLSSSLTSSSLSLPPSFGSDSLSSLTNFNPAPFGLHSTKHLSFNNPSPLPPPPHQQKRRRPNKNVRYNGNGMVLSKSHGLGSQASNSAPFGMPVKNPYINSAYYSALQYPYLFSRPNSASVTNAYPYRNLSKNPYSSLITGPLTSKLAAAAAASSGLYSDDSRFHGSNSYDSLANVASSLRPSTTMRLRPKPLVFQPHVLPIYTRHTILTQDVKK